MSTHLVAFLDTKGQFGNHSNASWIFRLPDNTSKSLAWLEGNGWILAGVHERYFIFVKSDERSQ